MGLRDSLLEESCDIYVFLCHATYGNTERYLHGELNIFELPNMKDFDAAIVLANGIDYPESIAKITKKCDEAGIPSMFMASESCGLIMRR